ncbi:sulfate transporter family protein [Rhodoligotrophos defluvii]|uniref:sulfate transporter family protein n=1 Tax=Rhodoligotrophos defluvii TaxID=2561934 RepID=UPI0010C9F1F5|nr:sulfate transporter family protein [Rhodoligotrophos defluvii]
MISAALKALSDVLSPPFRKVLWKSLGLTILLLVGLWVVIEVVVDSLTLLPWAWANTIITVVAGLGLIALAILLIAPVTALFAGLFLDGVAEMVERKHYPNDPVGRELPLSKAIITALQFGLLVLAINLLLLPTLFLGIGVLAALLANAYLLGREFFEMIAMRHMPVEEARLLRRENSHRVLAAGFIPALLALVPLANLIVPLFATAYMVHIYKQIRKRGSL